MYRRSRSSISGVEAVHDTTTVDGSRYDIGGQYRHHFDWVASDKVVSDNLGGNRVTTFMVYLDDNCTGGGTNFPRLKAPADSKWCKFIDCDEPYATGVTFKPIMGNAIFWENLHPSNSSGHTDTWHAGLPVTSGSKTGLNIWTWLVTEGLVAS